MMRPSTGSDASRPNCWATIPSNWSDGVACFGGANPYRHIPGTRADSFSARDLFIWCVANAYHQHFAWHNMTDQANFSRWWQRFNEFQPVLAVVSALPALLTGSLTVASLRQANPFRESVPSNPPQVDIPLRPELPATADLRGTGRGTGGWTQMRNEYVMAEGAK